MSVFHFAKGDRVRTPSGTGTVLDFAPATDDGQEMTLAAVWVDLDRPRDRLYPSEWFTEHEEVVRL